MVQFEAYGPPEVVEIAAVDPPHAGPGEVRIAVRASGLSTGEVRIRSGALREIVPARFPWRTGFDAAGVIDEVGDGVEGVAVGEEVFGIVASALRGANADHAVLVAWAPRPPAWSWEEAGGAAGSVETATRVLDRLEVGKATLLVQGGAGATGAVVVQMARARGAAVVATASAENHGFVTSLGATPTTYGPGLVDRVRALAPEGVGAVLDCAGGALPELVALAGDPARVVTIADLGAAAHGVHLSHGAPAGEAAGTGADPLAVHGLPVAVSLAAEGLLRVPVAAAFPLEEAAAAHRLSERRHAPGRIVLVN